MIKILSIDGGGIRGIIPAMILSEIEKRTGKPISKIFDIIAGTSTGGILALGLVKPNGKGNPAYSAKELIKLYEIEGNNIFSNTIWHKIESADGLLEEKYPSAGLESVLKKYFNETRLSEALTNVIIPSYEIEQRKPWFFKSFNAKDIRKKNEDFLMRDAARATSAAPTYFEPAKINLNSELSYIALIDGAVFANNPSMCAYAEAKSIFQKNDDILLVSLGTGEHTRPILYNNTIDWGLARWARPILGVVFDGINDTVDYQLKQLLKPNHDSKRYYRFQVELDIGNNDIDDASQINIHFLKLLGEKLMSETDDDIINLCKQLNA